MEGISFKDKIFGIFDSVKKYNQYPEAIEQIKKLTVSDEELFEILWTESIRSQSLEGKVFPSAYVLYKLNVKCPLEPKEAVQQVSKEWDISIEEIPWYLVNQFSKEVIIDVVNELNFDENVRFKTILYWVNLEMK